MDPLSNVYVMNETGDGFVLAKMLPRPDEFCLVNVHPETECKGSSCIIHRPSDHHMRKWKFNWWKGLWTERLCPHGVSHPDPDDLFPDKVHTCDGCCQKPKAEEMNLEEV